MEKKLLIEQAEALVKDYKEGGPYRLGESQETARMAVLVINSCPEAVAILEAAGVMFRMVGAEAAVFSKEDFEHIGGIVLSVQDMNDLADRHGDDAEAIARELEIEAHKVAANRKIQ